MFKRQRKKGSKSIDKTSGKYFYLFISPWLIGFFCFILLPMLFSLYTSFTEWDAVKMPVFIGLKNYIDIFSSDDGFWTSILNTLYFTGVAIPLNLVISLGLALLLNKRLYGTNFFRGVFYLPTILAGVAIYITWMYLFNADTGVLNTLLSYVGLKGPKWLLDFRWAMPSLIFILLAGLQDVPEDCYESAHIDGATKSQCFRKITLPMLSPVIFFNLIMGVINGLQIFTQPFIMTEGGPANATYVYGLHLYNSAFRYYKFGYASALAWILFTLILFLSFVIFLTSKFWVFYREEV
jgi:multiple sugar transport system permease protein